MWDGWYLHQPTTASLNSLLDSKSLRSRQISSIHWEASSFHSLLTLFASSTLFKSRNEKVQRSNSFCAFQCWKSPKSGIGNILLKHRSLVTNVMLSISVFRQKRTTCFRLLFLVSGFQKNMVADAWLYLWWRSRFGQEWMQCMNADACSRLGSRRAYWKLWAYDHRVSVEAQRSTKTGTVSPSTQVFYRGNQSDCSDIRAPRLASCSKRHMLLENSRRHPTIRIEVWRCWLAPAVPFRRSFVCGNEMIQRHQSTQAVQKPWTTPCRHYDATQRCYKMTWWTKWSLWRVWIQELAWKQRVNCANNMPLLFWPAEISTREKLRPRRLEGCFCRPWIWARWRVSEISFENSISNTLVWIFWWTTGKWIFPFSLTENGFEIAMGCNHLRQFSETLFVDRTVGSVNDQDSQNTGKPSRLVIVSSAHTGETFVGRANIDLEDFTLEAPRISCQEGLCIEQTGQLSSCATRLHTASARQADLPQSASWMVANPTDQGSGRHVYRRWCPNLLVLLSEWGRGKQ